MKKIIQLYPPNTNRANLEHGVNPDLIRVNANHDVSPDLLQAYWSNIRCTGPDFFAIVVHDGEPKQVQHGWMPQGGNFSTEDLRRYNVELEDLKLFLVKNLETEATQVRMVSDIHVIRNENLHACCMYCRCKKGVIGVGWRFEDGSLTKARLMCAFTLYSLGLMNANNDPILWEVAYRHLPFITGINKDEADLIILQHLTET